MGKELGSLWWVKWCERISISICTVLALFIVFLLISPHQYFFSILVTAILLSWHLLLASVFRNIRKYS